MRSPWAPTFEPLFLVLAAAALVAYLRAARGARPATPRWRVTSFVAGALMIAVAVNSPLETIAVDYLVLFHLLQNVILADWAPPLLIIGLTPAMRIELARHGGPAFAALTRPVVALPVWLVGWYVIHLGGVYDFALRHPWVLNVEHLVMVAIGFLFWWPVIAEAPHAVATLVRLGYVFGAFVLSAFLGLALTFSPPVYSYYEELPERLWGISAEADQNLGGILMSSEQALVFFAAIAWLLVRLLREEEEAERALRERQRAEGLI